MTLCRDMRQPVPCENEGTWLLKLLTGLRRFGLPIIINPSPSTCSLLTLKMPGMDGGELARQLKLSRPNLPVLMVTGEHAGNIPTELTSYVVDILPKPVRPRPLV